MELQPHVNWKPAFLAALASVPVVQRACDAVGIERCNAYRARKGDKAFAEAWDEALEAGVDKAEVELFRRAVDGFEEPVIDRGRLVYRHHRSVDEEGEEHWAMLLDDAGQPIPLTIRRHSDALLALIMKGRRKKLYAERTELTGADGDQLVAMDETARLARMAQLMAVAKARANDASEFEVPPDFDLA